MRTSAQNSFLEIINLKSLIAVLQTIRVKHLATSRRSIVRSNVALVLRRLL